MKRCDSRFSCCCQSYLLRDLTSRFADLINDAICENPYFELYNIPLNQGVTKSGLSIHSAVSWSSARSHDFEVMTSIPNCCAWARASCTLLHWPKLPSFLCHCGCTIKSWLWSDYFKSWLLAEDQDTADYQTIDPVKNDPRAKIQRKFDVKNINKEEMSLIAPLYFLEQIVIFWKIFSINAVIPTRLLFPTVNKS